MKPFLSQKNHRRNDENHPSHQQCHYGDALRISALLLLTLPVFGCRSLLSTMGLVTEVQVHLGEVEVPPATLLGAVRVQLAEFEGNCVENKAFTLHRVRRKIEPLEHEDRAIRIALHPDRLSRLSIRHQTGEMDSLKMCTAEVWFVPERGARYDVTFHSSLDSCVAVQASRQDWVLKSLPACEGFIEGEQIRLSFGDTAARARIPH